MFYAQSRDWLQQYSKLYTAAAPYKLNCYISHPLLSQQQPNKQQYFIYLFYPTTMSDLFVGSKEEKDVNGKGHSTDYKSSDKGLVIYLVYIICWIK